MHSKPVNKIYQHEPITKFLQRLEGVRPTAPGRWVAKCPAHRDRRPSLSVRALDDGRVLVYCFSGCSAAEIVDAVGLDLSDLFPARDRVGHHVPGTRPYVPASDVLRLIYNEAHLVLVTAYSIAQGHLTEEDRARLEIAIERLTDALTLAGSAR